MTELSIFTPRRKSPTTADAPENLGIFERLERYPDSFSDDDLRDLMERYEGQTLKGRNATIPHRAFVILESRHSR